MKIKLFLLFPFVAMLSPLQAVEIDASVNIRLGKILPPPPPEVIIVEQAPRAGPPPWAPAHGARRNHTYYYYPGADVYFRPEDRMWFYLEGSDWRFGASLPSGIRVDFNRAVSVDMETDRPYQFHREVRTYYPADYFVTRVKVKEKSEKPDKEKFEDHDRDRGDDSPGKDGPGRGKGKGRDK